MRKNSVIKASMLTAAFICAGLQANAEEVTISGACIVDVNLTLTDTVGDYAYSSKHSQDLVYQVKMFDQIVQWDIDYGVDGANNDDTGLMSLSVKYGLVSQGDCIDEIRLVPTGDGSSAAIPSSYTGQPWNFRGAFGGQWAWSQKVEMLNGKSVPTTNTDGYSGYDNGLRPTISVFTRKAQLIDKTVKGKVFRRSTFLVTGLVAGCKTEAMTRCIGGWGDTNGTTTDLQVKRLSIETMLNNGALTKLNGNWELLKTCNNCTVEYQVSQGISQGEEIGRETELGKELSIMVGASTGIGPVDVETQITGTWSESTRNSVLNSFTKSRETAATVTCERGALYGWKTTVERDCTGIPASLCSAGPTVAYAGHYFCTNTGDTPDEAQKHDISWGGCDTVFKGTQVDTSDDTAVTIKNSNVRYNYQLDGSYVCVK